MKERCGGLYCNDRCKAEFNRDHNNQLANIRAKKKRLLKYLVNESV